MASMGIKPQMRVLFTLWWILSVISFRSAEGQVACVRNVTAEGNETAGGNETTGDNETTIEVFMCADLPNLTDGKGCDRLALFGADCSQCHHCPGGWIVDAHPIPYYTKPTPDMWYTKYCALGMLLMFCMGVVPVCFVVCYEDGCPKFPRRAFRRWTTGVDYMEWDNKAPYFYFFPSGYFRDTIAADSFINIPWQRLWREGYVIKRSIPLLNAYGNPEYMKNTLIVSHRWQSPNSPDLSGRQLAAIKEHLKQNPHISYVWFDWCCMPQKRTYLGNNLSRTRWEQFEYDRMLSMIHNIYLTSSVLILLDSEYPTRFWTLMEAWFANMTPTSTGVQPARSSERRVTFKYMHDESSKDREAEDREALNKMVLNKTPEEMYSILASPDVNVTYAEDKDKMLPLVSNIDAYLKSFRKGFFLR